MNDECLKKIKINKFIKKTREKSSDLKYCHETVTGQ